MRTIPFRAAGLTKHLVATVLTNVTHYACATNDDVAVGARHLAPIHVLRAIAAINLCRNDGPVKLTLGADLCHDRGLERMTVFVYFSHQIVLGLQTPPPTAFALGHKVNVATVDTRHRRL